MYSTSYYIQARAISGQILRRQKIFLEVGTRQRLLVLFIEYIHRNYIFLHEYKNANFIIYEISQEFPNIFFQ